MTDAVSRFDNSTLTGALNRDAVALNNIAKATNDTAHNLAAESTIAGRSRNTFQNVYYSYMGGEAAGILENDVQYYIRGAGTPMDSQVKTHLSLLGDASFFRYKMQMAINFLHVLEHLITTQKIKCKITSE